MKKDLEKEMLEYYKQDAERFKNFCLFIIGAAIGTISAILILNSI